MFQRLNNMFAAAKSVASREPEFNEKEENEWILVDFIVDSCTKLSEDLTVIEEISCIDETAPLSSSMGAFEQCENTSDSFFIHFNTPPMEESWFVTPPACFTARELTTTEVETSPMENLLIEHPSMSVYAARNLCHKEDTACESEFLSSGSLELNTEDETIGRHLHCYIAALAAHIKSLEKTQSYQCSKLSRRLSEKHLLNRKSLRRQNLIQGGHSRQAKHSGLLVHQPSKRRYNYI
ncbi:tumor protein p53-inducible nuclear protein 1 [Pelodytes ibericus]